MNSKLDIACITDMEMLKSTCDGKKVYLYGAGDRASVIHGVLKNLGISVCGFVVSWPDKSPKEKDGLCIMGADEYHADDSVLIFAIEAKGNNMCRQMVSQCIKRIYVFDRLFYDEQVGRYAKIDFNRIFNDDKYEIIEDAVVERNYILCKYRHDKKQVIFRVPLRVLYEKKFELLRMELLKENLIDLFEEEYGKFDFLLDNDVTESDEKKYNVYMARCHVDKEIEMPELPEWVIPIQTGTALTEMKICDVRDDQGENISERNRDYSECTAIYWMWKNAPYTDYIGLCHYRRHFFIPNNDISIIGSNRYDIVVTVPTMVVDGYQCFRTYIKEEDIDILHEIIKKFYPKYFDTTVKYYAAKFCPPCNMFIMKYEIFQEYGDFVFGVSEKIYAHYHEKEVIRNDRYMGYLVENLTGVFLMQHKDKYKIGYTNMKFFE